MNGVSLPTPLYRYGRETAANACTKVRRPESASWRGARSWGTDPGRQALPGRPPSRRAELLSQYMRENTKGKDGCERQREPFAFALHAGASASARRCLARAAQGRARPGRWGLHRASGMAECPEAFFAVPGRDPNASERSIVPSLGAWWTCRAAQPPRAMPAAQRRKRSSAIASATSAVGRSSSRARSKTSMRLSRIPSMWRISAARSKPMRS